jgi:hypothetical protein
VATLLTLHVAKALTTTSFVKSRVEGGFLVNTPAQANVGSAALTSNILNARKPAIHQNHALTYARKHVTPGDHAQLYASSHVPTVASTALVRTGVKMPAIHVSNRLSPFASMSLQILSAASRASQFHAHKNALRLLDAVISALLCVGKHVRHRSSVQSV